MRYKRSGRQRKQVGVKFFGSMLEFPCVISVRPFSKQGYEALDTARKEIPATGTQRETGFKPMGTMPK